MERTRSGEKSKLWRGAGGYTIVEVMVVLAVSGGLLIAIMGTISGQQQKTQFVTATRDFESKLQDIVNDVQTGYYENNGTTSCKEGATNTDKPDVNPVAAPLGTNENCLYLGKAIQLFNPASVDEPSPSFRVTTIAGLRQYDGHDVTSISEANPVAFNELGNGVSNFELVNGLELTKIIYWTSDTVAPTASSRGIAILSTLRNATSFTGNVASSGGRPKIAFVTAPAHDLSETGFANNIEALTDNSISQPIAGDGAVFCIRDGAGGRVSAVTLGLRLTGLTLPSPEVQASGQNMSTESYFYEDAEKFGCTSS